MTRTTRRLLDHQFARFRLVGASGYAVNLAVYAALLAAGMHYLAAAAIAFLVAAGSNYAWNRIWTFRTSEAPILGQGARALVVSALSLGANRSSSTPSLPPAPDISRPRRSRSCSPRHSASWRTSCGRSRSRPLTMSPGRSRWLPGG